MDILLKAQHNVDVDRTAESILPALIVAAKNDGWSPYEMRQVVARSFEFAEEFHKQRLERGKQ